MASRLLTNYLLLSATNITEQRYLKSNAEESGYKTLIKTNFNVNSMNHDELNAYFTKF